MWVDPSSPWTDHENVLKEFEEQAKAIGLDVVLDKNSNHLDAMLYDGRQMVCWLHYNPEEDGWASESHSRNYFPLGEIIRAYKSGDRRLTITVDYSGGEMPKVSEETVEAIKNLLPGQPGTVTVTPNESS